VWCDVEGPRWVGKKLSPIVASPAGNALTLRCPAAGDPPPNITWLKDDEPLEERYMGEVSWVTHCSALVRVHSLFLNLECTQPQGAHEAFVRETLDLQIWRLRSI